MSGSLERVRNPFVPTFGVQPPLLIGRDNELFDVRDGILEGPGSPLRANKFTGPRGIGKTVLLEAAADIARELGWIAISVTAAADMLDEILDIALEETSHLRDVPRRKVTNISISGTGVGLSSPVAERTPGWRVQMNRILDIVEAHDTGILFTIDEVSARHESLATFGKQFQHFRREGRSVAFAAAGLPLNVEEFESLPDTTFMRRATPHQLADVSVSAVRNALATTLRDLSALDKTFLVKMALDDGPSKMADITSRAGWSREQSNVYRSRLITAGMIRPAGHGMVEFAFPYLREFLREHAATIVWLGD